MREVKGHMKEVNTGECCYKNPNIFLSSGTDGRVKVWDLNVMKCVMDIPAHMGSSHQATWHPVNEGIFSSVGADGFLKIWDLNSPGKSIAGFRAHSAEILGCDFSKYEDVLATGSADLSIRLWDLKNLK